MKNTILTLILLLIGISMFGQEGESMKEKTNIPIFVGYYGPYGIQPGIKVGSQFDLKTRAIAKDDLITKTSDVFISPQLGTFTRPGNHFSLVVNADVGYKIKKLKQKLYVAPSLGFGYLTEFQVLSNTINLATGEVSKKTRDRRGYFLPTVNFEFGQDPRKKIAWYSKFSYGRKMSTRLEDSAFFAVELGLKFNLGIK